MSVSGSDGRRKALLKTFRSRRGLRPVSEPGMCATRWIASGERTVSRRENERPNIPGIDTFKCLKAFFGMEMCRSCKPVFPFSAGKSCWYTGSFDAVHMRAFSQILPRDAPGFQMHCLSFAIDSRGGSRYRVRLLGTFDRHVTATAMTAGNSHLHELLPATNHEGTRNILTHPASSNLHGILFCS